MVNILLIGCTGCLGQAIIYKLLTQTKDRLYIVIREKHNMTIKERFTDILKSIKLSLTDKYIKKRIKLINCTYDSKRKIQISDRVMKIITTKVNIFINALADIKFNRELHKAADNNITTALNWLDIYNQCNNAYQYTYVSTAFTGFHSGIENPTIKEDFHVNTCKEQTFEHCDETYLKILNKEITNSHIEPFENSYTYTKNLTELLLKKHIHNGSLYIVRPSIVLSAANYPYPGWGKFQTLNVAIFGMCTGKLLYYNHNGEKHSLNSVPVDLVADDCCKIIQEKSKIIHSCLTKNTPYWNKDDATMFKELSRYCYDSYKENPIIYNQDEYYPFKAKVYEKKYDFYIYIIYCILYRFISNIKQYGFIDSFSNTFKQLMFTIKYNKIFNNFSNKNYRFERKDEIDAKYMNLIQQEHIFKFIDNLSNNVKNDKNLYNLFIL